jgi:uncharacterized protein DUF2330
MARRALSPRLSPSVQRLGGTGLLAALLTLAASPGRPCAPAPPPGTYVSILAEQALIVWDPVARRQHFIRRARFESSAPDFGFLVPTPAPPELSEAPDAVFERLHEAIQPEVVHRTGLRPLPFALLALPFMFFQRGAAMDGAGMPVTAAAPQARPPVRVLDEKRVAGYDAVVLQADDAPALLRWLEDHKYDARPELREWLRAYVDQHWTITAFKVAGGSVSTQAVRMSFATDRPFFPYREPEDQREGALEGPGRELVVYLVAPGRMDGTIGASRNWAVHVPFSAPRAGLDAIVAPALPAGTALPPGAWLNAFFDTTSPRPGVDDLFFAPERTQQAVIPPPVVLDERTDLPLPVDAALGLVVGGWWWRRRRARRASPA